MSPPVFRRLLRVPEIAAVRSGRRLLTWQRHPAPGRDGRPGWLPVWSVPAWIRALRAAVGDDLADAFRRGAVYLTQAVSWVLGPRAQPPDTAVAAVTAGIRLDEAIRGYLAEQGAKRVTKEDLWSWSWPPPGSASPPIRWPACWDPGPRSARPRPLPATVIPARCTTRCGG